MFVDLPIFLIASLAINIGMFMVAYPLQTDKLTDISYAASFVILSLFGLFTYEVTPLTLLVAGMVCIWAARLGTFLLIRIRKTGTDSRFDAMRGDPWKFGKFWLAQGLSVWVILLAAEMLFYNHTAVFTTVSGVGAVIWLVGLLIESVADWQKFRFTQNPANKGHWIDEGLWHFSRHPNYLGEMLVWIGLYLVVMPNLTAFEAVVASLSPLYIICLLLFVSGVPPLEKLADERWGKDKAYQAYKKRTSILFLWPPRA